jgi:hypothetical protein
MKFAYRCCFVHFPFFLVFFASNRHTVDQQLVQPVPLRVQGKAHHHHHQMHRTCATIAAAAVVGSVGSVGSVVGVVGVTGVVVLCIQRTSGVFDKAEPHYSPVVRNGNAATDGSFNENNPIIKQINQINQTNRSNQSNQPNQSIRSIRSIKSTKSIKSIKSTNKSNHQTIKQPNHQQKNVSTAVHPATQKTKTRVKILVTFVQDVFLSRAPKPHSLLVGGRRWRQRCLLGMHVRVFHRHQQTATPPGHALDANALLRGNLGSIEGRDGIEESEEK